MVGDFNKKIIFFLFLFLLKKIELFNLMNNYFGFQNTDRIITPMERFYRQKYGDNWKNGITYENNIETTRRNNNTYLSPTDLHFRRLCSNNNDVTNVKITHEYFGCVDDYTSNNNRPNWNITNPHNICGDYNDYDSRGNKKDPYRCHFEPELHNPPYFK